MWLWLRLWHRPHDAIVAAGIWSSPDVQIQCILFNSTNVCLCFLLAAQLSHSFCYNSLVIHLWRVCIQMLLNIVIETTFSLLFSSFHHLAVMSWLGLFCFFFITRVLEYPVSVTWVLDSFASRFVRVLFIYRTFSKVISKQKLHFHYADGVYWKQNSIKAIFRLMSNSFRNLSNVEFIHIFPNNPWHAFSISL